MKDIGALLDWIAQQPELDVSRVGVVGGSYGGYMVLASLMHYSNGQPVWYLLYADEGHGFRKKSNTDYFGAAGVLFWEQNQIGRAHV